MSQAVVDGCLSGPQRSADATPLQSLSAREREILQLVAEGHTSQEIAQALFLSAKTVETHPRDLTVKLQLDSVAAVMHAIREGLTSLDG